MTDSPPPPPPQAAPAKPCFPSPSFLSTPIDSSFFGSATPPPRRKRTGFRRKAAAAAASSSGAAPPPPPVIPPPPPPTTLPAAPPAVAPLPDEILVINREATNEAVAALSAGFPADSLTDEEIEAGVVADVGGIEQVNYILIRNHLLCRWRADSSRWLDQDPFFSIIPPQFHPLLRSAYSFLLSYGCINYGVAPAVKDHIPKEPTRPGCIIIVGAGLAGLAAARQLMSFGFRVVILEGRKRPGGRVYTKKLEGPNSKSAAADLGGSVLTGTLGNPLVVVAKQLGLNLHKIRDKCPLYRKHGQPVNPQSDAKVESVFNRLLDKVSDLRLRMGDVAMDVSLGAALDAFRSVTVNELSDEEKGLLEWHLANLEYANAGLLSCLSLVFWDQDDPFDMGGDHCFLNGANGQLIHALAENVPIVYDRTVQTVRYGADGVQVVTTNGQVYEGDMVLCTVSLGVLKSGSVKFVPELPQRKLDSIKRMGFGLLNKVAMLFPYVFWSTEIDTFGHLTEETSSRGEFFLFYSYATVSGGPLLIALVAGVAAQSFETMPPTDAVNSVLQILRGIYAPQGIEVPDPLQSVCTRWGTDPLSLGSYSHVAIGASGDDYDVMAESVGEGRLFFAGEATTRRYPATMHGAFLSGLREAANIAHHAKIRVSNVKPEKSPSVSTQACAALLADLFREPNVEFGAFAAIFVSGQKPPAILRVTLGKKGGGGGDSAGKAGQQNKLFQQLHSLFNQERQVHVYALVSREQVMELRLLRGGDEVRLCHLCEKQDVKLLNRKGLGPAADAVIAAIKAERSSKRAKRTTGTIKRKQ